MNGHAIKTLVTKLYAGAAIAAPWKLWKEAQALGLIEARRGEWVVTPKGKELIVRE